MEEEEGEGKAEGEGEGEGEREREGEGAGEGEGEGELRRSKNLSKSMCSNVCMKTECCWHGIALVEVGPGCFPAMSSGVSRQACSVICYDLQNMLLFGRCCLL